MSIDLIKENGFTLKKKQEADDTAHKLLQTQTMLMQKYSYPSQIPAA